MIHINRARCCSCGTCIPTCPGANIELIDAFLQIGSDCPECGICVDICPVGALEVVHED